MKMRYNFAFLATLFIASSASAATISYSLNYGPEAVGLAPHSVGGLSQFNPALGTLNSVKLTLDATANAGILLWDNESDQTGNVTLSIGGTVTATSSLGGFTVVAVPSQTAGPQFVTADNDGSPDFLGSDSFLVSGGTGNDMQMQTLTLPGDIGPYVGLGSFTVNVGSTLYTNVATTGGAIFGPTLPTAGANLGMVTVTYDYTAIPEPSSMALVGLGAASLIVAIRKRKTA